MHEICPTNEEVQAWTSLAEVYFERSTAAIKMCAEITFVFLPRGLNLYNCASVASFLHCSYIVHVRRGKLHRSYTYRTVDAEE